MLRWTRINSQVARYTTRVTTRLSDTDTEISAAAAAGERRLLSVVDRSTTPHERRLQFAIASG